jgi:hypothetical protein
LPSGENATEWTYELWPCSVVTSFCDSTLQSLTVFSVLPEAKYFPSGENVTELTPELWPVKSGYLPYFRFLKSL